ncbi:uncharacterized protein LOC129985247 [Argiope bruennichi]|uniref:uncharacterized protein LOC129985247 n=1 Tax=Argiope bruennichi TaxID=94029 RepID=UPI0024941252|nr:uncharacterized protein LOC129985247 [Argiope bruennichi]
MKNFLNEQTLGKRKFNLNEINNDPVFLDHLIRICKGGKVLKFQTRKICNKGFVLSQFVTPRHHSQKEVKWAKEKKNGQKLSLSPSSVFYRFWTMKILKIKDNQQQ